MKARVLIIEDNPVNLELFVCLLEAGGYQTIRALDGDAGLRAARDVLPDLIVCDVLLPGISGIELAQHLKRDPMLCSIPLVAVTAHAMVGDRERVLSAGFDGYISKPIEPRKFLSQIEQFLLPKARQVAREPERKRSVGL